MKYVPNYPDIDDLFSYHKIPDIEFPTYEEGKSPYELLESQSAYLEKTSKELHNMAESAKSQANSAKTIAETSKVQADLAIEESQRANKTSIAAMIRSNISTVVSVSSLFLSLVINADKIVHNGQKILSYLIQLLN